ncbi:hypothetical protein C8Q69DRAFT_440643 [Paecilomyces variotii]|uniref:Uncharacterized protein n=1 Tax=Byssochlamys spectabilis TaxID=264951 RepID=A0A443I691_BYSSP|nr:hypothetical protein C8Q69DRAFT_440643 [Paecilomyces variotii]RWQ99557.1 hypothetical protein C8Q69DRAFT_440643 [Paecilomyces variotii]
MVNADSSALSSSKKLKGTAVNKLTGDFFTTALIRIWESLRWLRDATLARCSNKRKQQGSVPVLQCDLPLDFRGRALQGYHNTFYPNTHRESVHLVRPLKRMIAMVLQIDGKIYITGLEFIFDGMPNVLIGYKTPGAVIIDSNTPELVNRRMYKYPGIGFTTEISCLRGFGIHITPGGLHFMTVIQEDVTYYLGGNPPPRESQECDLRLDEVMEVTLESGVEERGKIEMAKIDGTKWFGVVAECAVGFTEILFFDFLLPEFLTGGFFDTFVTSSTLRFSSTG